MLNKGLTISALCCAMLVASPPVSAQAFPTKPIRVVVGFAPGGSTDKLARVIAQGMSEDLKQSVVVENRPGAAGNLASELVASSPPDGYTLFMTTLSSQAINPHLYNNLRFDPMKSFEPISLIAKYPLLLMVSPQLPVNTAQQFIDYARSTPGLHFSSAGNGSPAHLAGEIFKSALHSDATHIPYRGGSPAMMAVMANEVQFAFETIPSAIGLVRGGKLKGLAVTSSQRSSAAPELPTMSEAGMKQFTITSWAGLVAPAGTPAPVVQRLVSSVHAAMNDSSVRKSLANDGAEPGSGGPAEFAQFMSDELKRWGSVVREAGAKVE